MKSHFMQELTFPGTNIVILYLLIDFNHVNHICCKQGAEHRIAWSSRCWTEDEKFSIYGMIARS